MTRSAAAERTRREIIRLCGAGLDAPTLRSQVLQRLRTVVPVDAAFFASVDPATLLFTDATVDAVLRPDALRFLSNEFMGDDVNQFVQLARSPVAVRTLGQATALHWEKSPRYRDILAPLALGDELRAALRTGGLCWGVLCLHREGGQSLFTSAEASFVAALSPHLARGLRVAMLAEAIPTAQAANGPGLLVLAPDLSVVASTPLAEQWLADAASDRTPPGDLPRAVYAVAARLRAIEQDQSEIGAELMPRARVRTTSGRWLLVHASRLAGAGTEGHTAIFLEEARPMEIAPLILSAHEFTPREAEITQLVLRGHSTAEIAERLCLSLNTVQDYLKSIFDKLGIHSRRELVGRIFAEHYLPHMTRGEASQS